MARHGHQALHAAGTCAVGDTLGVVTADAAKSTGLPEGVRVIAGAADKACEVLGVGALEPGVASVSCGTTATINTTRPQYGGRAVHARLPRSPA